MARTLSPPERSLERTRELAPLPPAIAGSRGYWSTIRVSEAWQAHGPALALTLRGAWVSLHPLALALMERLTSPIYGLERGLDSLLAVRIPRAAKTAATLLVKQAQRQGVEISLSWEGGSRLDPAGYLAPLYYDQLQLDTQRLSLPRRHRAQTGRLVLYRLAVADSASLMQYLGPAHVVAVLPLAQGALVYAALSHRQVATLRRHGARLTAAVAVPGIGHYRYANHPTRSIRLPPGEPA